MFVLSLSGFQFTSPACWVCPKPYNRVKQGYVSASKPCQST
jgi:hypothetical protein